VSGVLNGHVVSNNLQKVAKKIAIKPALTVLEDRQRHGPMKSNGHLANEDRGRNVPKRAKLFQSHSDGRYPLGNDHRRIHFKRNNVKSEDSLNGVQSQRRPSVCGNKEFARIPSEIDNNAQTTPVLEAKAKSKTGNRQETTERGVFKTTSGARGQAGNGTDSRERAQRGERDVCDDNSDSEKMSDDCCNDVQNHDEAKLAIPVKSVKVQSLFDENGVSSSNVSPVVSKNHYVIGANGERKETKARRRFKEIIETLNKLPDNFSKYRRSRSSSRVDNFDDSDNRNDSLGSRKTSLSQKSLSSIGSQTSLADRIIEQRSLYKNNRDAKSFGTPDSDVDPMNYALQNLCIKRSSLSPAMLQELESKVASSASQNDGRGRATDSSLRPETARRAVSLDGHLENVNSRKASKGSDIVFKKHLPDTFPSAGENSTPLPKRTRTTNRRVYQS